MDTLRHIIPLLTADSSTVVTPILCTAIVIFRPMQSISLTPRLIFHILLIPASRGPFKKPLIYFRYNPTSIPINGNGNHRRRNSLQSTAKLCHLLHCMQFALDGKNSPKVPFPYLTGPESQQDQVILGKLEHQGAN
jgi:hypothetical protein